MRKGSSFLVFYPLEVFPFKKNPSFCWVGAKFLERTIRSSHIEKISLNCLKSLLFFQGFWMRSLQFSGKLWFLDVFLLQSFKESAPREKSKKSLGPFLFFFPPFPHNSSSFLSFSFLGNNLPFQRDNSFLKENKKRASSKEIVKFSGKFEGKRSFTNEKEWIKASKLSWRIVRRLVREIHRVKLFIKWSATMTRTVLMRKKPGSLLHWLFPLIS